MLSLLFAWCADASAASGTTVDIDVVGPLAEIALHRRFVHTGAIPVDAELVVPVPAGGAIDGVTVTVGDRVLRSRVVERQQARREYAEAANAGRSATLLEHARDDVVVQRVANVLPGEEVEVEILLAVPVDRHDGIWELVLPLTVAPRFRDDLDLVHAIPPEALDGVPDAGPRTVRPEERGDVTVTIHGGSPLRWLQSPSHPFQAVLDGADGALDVRSTPMDRDLVVQWATALPEPAASLLVADGHGLLLLEAPAPFVPVEPAPSDVVVLIDASDSMLGSRSAQIPGIVERVLAMLRPDDRATVLLYADSVRGVAVREPPDRAPAIVERLRRAPLGGGSELPDALRVALAVPAPPERALSVLLVTDGATAQDAAVAEAMRGRIRGAVHTLAVGPAPNHALLQAIAQETGGLALTLPPGADPDEALAPLRDGLRGPVITDVRIDWSAPDVLPADGTQPLQLYADRAAYRYARGLSCGAAATVTGLLAGRPWSVVARAECVDAARPLAVLWARARIDALARSGSTAEVLPITELAVEYQLLTAWTSLVGTGEEVINPGGLAALSRLAVPLPASVEVSEAYGLAGSTLSDPVTGTFSSNFNFDALLERDRSVPVPLPSDGLAPEDAPSGTNYLQGTLALDAGALGEVGGVETATLAARTSGPLVRDRAWLVAEAHDALRTLDGVDSEQFHLASSLAVQPVPEHRFTLSGALDPARIRWRGGEAEYGRMGGTAQWRWYPSSQSHTTAQGSIERLWLGNALRERASARVDALSFSARHDLRAGADASGWRWTADGAEHSVPTLSAYAQDSAELGRQLRLAGGLRLDAVLGQQPAWLSSPRLYATWRTGDDRLALSAGFGRMIDLDRLVPPGLADVVAPASTELAAQIDVEVLHDLFLYAHGRARDEQLPLLPPPELAPAPIAPVDTVERRVATLALGFRRELANRIEAGGAWLLTPQLPGSGAGASILDPLAPLVPGLLDAYRPHRLQGSIRWDLPVSLHTMRLSGTASWGSPVAGADGDAPWWLGSAVLAGVAIEQELALWRGTLALRLSAEGSLRSADGAWLPLQTQLLVPGAPSIGEQPPVWSRAAVEYRF